MSKGRILRFTDKHALIVAHRNEFDSAGVIGYIKKKPVEALKEQDEFDLPDGWSITQKHDDKGEVMCTKDGEPLSFFTWK